MLAEGIGPDDVLALRDNILFSFEIMPKDNAEETEQQIVLSGTRILMSDEIAEQLRARIAPGSLRKSHFTVSDTEELNDVIDTLVAYGLLMRA